MGDLQMQKGTTDRISGKDVTAQALLSFSLGNRPGY